MALGLNSLSPTTFTTSTLIADLVATTGGSVDSIPSITTSAGKYAAAALEVQSTLGGLLIPRMTTTQVNAMANTTTTPIDGTLVYDTTLGVFRMRVGGAWITSATTTGVNTLTLGTSATTSGVLTFLNSANANTLSFTPGATSTNLSFILPTADATVVNAPLVSNTSAVLSFNNNAIVSDTTTLTQANILAANATPIQLIPAPGAGKAIMVVNAQVYVNFQTTAFAAGGVGVVQYDNTAAGAGTNALAATIPSAQITAADSRVYALNGNTGNALQTITNKGIFFSNQTAAFTNGNAASTVVITLQYMVIDATA